MEDQERDQGGKEEGGSSFRTGRILLGAEVGFQMSCADWEVELGWALLTLRGLKYQILARAWPLAPALFPTCLGD